MAAHSNSEGSSDMVFVQTFVCIPWKGITKIPFSCFRNIEQTGKPLFLDHTVTVLTLEFYGTSHSFSGFNLYFQNISGCYSSYTVLPVANPIQRSALLENLGATAHCSHKNKQYCQFRAKLFF